MEKTSTRGFTLLEALVAITIVAILVGISVPALNKSRASAKSTQVQANLRTLNTLSSQMRSAGFSNAASTGSDTAAALAFIRARGWIRTNPEPDFSGLVFENGVWKERP